MTNELAVIETEAIEVEGYEGGSLCEFFERDELAGDFTNWWAPSVNALAGLCRAAGFRRVEATTEPLPAPAEQPTAAVHGPQRWLEMIGRRGRPAPALRSIKRFRATIHAYK